MVQLFTRREWQRALFSFSQFAFINIYHDKKFWQKKVRTANPLFHWQTQISFVAIWTKIWLTAVIEYSGSTTDQGSGCIFSHSSRIDWNKTEERYLSPKLGKTTWNQPNSSIKFGLDKDARPYDLYWGVLVHVSMFVCVSVNVHIHIYRHVHICMYIHVYSILEHVHVCACLSHEKCTRVSLQAWSWFEKGMLACKRKIWIMFVRIRLRCSQLKFRIFIYKHIA